MILGIMAGYVCHANILDAATLKSVAGYFSMLADIFLRLIRMIIAPLVFVSLVSGLSGMNSGKDVGRIGLRTVGWFICASLISLLLGLALSSILAPGAWRRHESGGKRQRYGEYRTQYRGAERQGCHHACVSGERV